MPANTILSEEKDDPGEGQENEEEIEEEKSNGEINGEQNGEVEENGDEQQLNGNSEMNGEEEEKEEICEDDYINHELYCSNNAEPIAYNPDMISEDEVKELAGKDIPSPAEFHPVFSKFIFSPRDVKEEDTPLAIMSMMKDLDFLRRWCIPKEALARFILMAKRGYNDNPYHNWKHAFSVTHFAYLMLKNVELIKLNALNHLEALAFFISAICHDLDHRGTNNAFQIKCKSTLSSMYPSESSVMERHHIMQGKAILETNGCNILSNLTSTEVKEFLETMKTIILASRPRFQMKGPVYGEKRVKRDRTASVSSGKYRLTEVETRNTEVSFVWHFSENLSASDIVNHFRILPDLYNMLEDDTYNPKDPDHHDIVLCLLMTACDLSDQTKDWKSAIAAAGTVYQEFLAQGDLEKLMGLEPMDMMNRQCAVVTDLQVGFIEKVAIPVYTILSKIFPSSYDALRGILINKKKWRRLQFLYSNSVEDPDMEAPDPCSLQTIINVLDFEGAEREY